MPWAADLAPREQAVTSVQSIHLGFLGGRPFVAKTPDYRGWICLDFLGFSRPNLDLSMGYVEKAWKIFSRASPPNVSGAATGGYGFGRRKRRIAHKASLTYILIFQQ
jgi:hypothetical protein